MSRLGKLAIKLNNNISTKFSDSVLSVKGPKGELSLNIPAIVELKISPEEILVSTKGDNKKSKSFWGLFRSLINNMVVGVSEGFEKKLEVNGVGYKVALSGRTLNLNLGYSQPINFDLPDKVEAQVEGNLITLSSIDKKLLGDTAYKIRSFRKPEPYKGKGIKYQDEVIRRKAGKTAAKATK
jgi:large subunit ribosomal protein L6